MNGGGKYDDEATAARDAAGAEGVVLIVYNGREGSGFSVQLPQAVLFALPSVLRQMADHVEEDLVRGIKAPEGEQPS